MNYKTFYKDKLSKMLFLEIDEKGFKKLIKIPDNIEFECKDLYIPISAEYVAENAQNELKIHNIPIYYFIEGMFTALGADEKLKFNNDYSLILSYIPDSEECIKSVIADRVKKDNFLDAYIFLRGLFRYNGEKEIIVKLLAVGEKIREKDSGFSDILYYDIDMCKEKFKKLADPYLYEALILKDDKDYKGAEVKINEYLRRGGKRDSLVNNFIRNITNLSHFEKATDLVHEQPEKAIAYLVPLLEQFEKNPLIYYYLGVSYRKLENYEKAIYYLREGISLDSGILEMVNELGMNFALIGDYSEAVKYFRKAFEASKDIDICTNLVMCYINMNDIDMAKKTLEIAKKLKPDDEVVQDIDKMLNRQEK
ncbi:tetratricopeptide repeat protein [Clostridium sp. BJN0001]|uniref:tetratricopeptide repeat protein n=1 Tax=Clostridium sp. BJN0001 TaxID=2930219 RepID=UPI001FD32A66|nr:tetratricopeptide repeat protein [Clostridium sp. BJN0001]